MPWYESSQKPRKVKSPDPAVISQMKSVMRAEVAKWAPQCKIIKFRFDPEDGGRLHAAIQGDKSGELVTGVTMRYGRKTVESSGGHWDDSGIAMDLALDSRRSRLHAALDHVLDAKKHAKDSKTDASRYSARPAALKYTTVAQMQAAKEDPDSAYDLYAEGKISEALYEAVCKRGVLKYAKDSSEIDEVEAFDIGFADAKKGRAANPRSDWTPWLKKAYDEGYKSGCR